jgi:formiminotetrahydrofolate cyclodeaminase
LVAAGARAGQENVRINLPSVVDEGLRASIAARTESLLARIGDAARHQLDRLAA